MPRLRILVRTAVQSHWAMQGVGCLGALTITAIVGAAVPLFLGVDNGPRGIKLVLPWLYGATLVFGIATAAVWFRSKRDFRLMVGDGDVLHLKIGAAKTKGPFTCEYAYFIERMKGIPICHLTLHVYDSDSKHVCSLGETWGAAHGAPNGWREDIVPPKGPPGPAWVAAKGRFLDDVREEIEMRAG